MQAGSGFAVGALVFLAMIGVGALFSLRAVGIIKAPELTFSTSNLEEGRVKNLPTGSASALLVLLKSDPKTFLARIHSNSDDFQVARIFIFPLKERDKEQTEALDGLIKTLRSEGPSDQRAAAASLIGMFELGRDAMRALAFNPADPDPDILIRLIGGLSKNKVNLNRLADEMARNFLRIFTQNTDPRVRSVVLEGLRETARQPQQMQQLRAELSPFLALIVQTQALGEGDRSNAVLALAPFAEDHLPMLAREFETGSELVRLAILQVVGEALRSREIPSSVHSRLIVLSALGSREMTAAVRRGASALMPLVMQRSDLEYLSTLCPTEEDEHIKRALNQTIEELSKKTD